MAGAALLAVVVTCCNVYDKSLLDPIDPGVASKSGIGWWSGDGDRGCYSARQPTLADRPAAGSGADQGEIYLAIQSMRLGSLDENGQADPNAWQGIGYDLDDTCTGSDTCQGTDSPSSCKPTGPQTVTDGHNCRDNTFGRLEYTAGLVGELSKKYGLSDDAFNCALCVGDYNFIIRVTGYNGEANDDHVRLDLYPSPGLEQPLPWDCSKPDWVTHPCFRPDQAWTVQDDFLVDKHGGPSLSPSKIFDDTAFVKDGYLIGSLPNDTVFWFPGYNALVTAYPLKLQQGRVSGKISRGGDGVWRIADGIIAGRARAADVVGGLRSIGFCEADSNYPVMLDFVKNNLDVLADGRKDAEVTCDAMSVGLGFVAQQSQIGRTATVESPRECVLRGRATDDAGPPADTDASDASAP